MSKCDVSRLEGARSINKYFTVAHLALYLVNTGVGGNRFRFKVCRKKRQLNGFRRYISVVICAKTCPRHPSRKMSWYFRNLWCASAYYCLFPLLLSSAGIELYARVNCNTVHMFQFEKIKFQTCEKVTYHFRVSVG